MEGQRPISSFEDLEQRPRAAFSELQELRNKEKIEFNRFKQDCRKRALEASLQISQSKTYTNTEIKTIADIYYQWLIEIPE